MDYSLTLSSADLCQLCVKTFSLFPRSVIFVSDMPRFVAVFIIYFTGKLMNAVLLRKDEGIHLIVAIIDVSVRYS